MSRRPGGRHPEGWDREKDGDANDGDLDSSHLAFSMDSRPSSTIDRQNNNVDISGLVGPMRLDPDPGGFREKYLQTFGGLQGYSKEGITKLDFLVKCACDVLAKAMVPTKSGFSRTMARTFSTSSCTSLLGHPTVVTT